MSSSINLRTTVSLICPTLQGGDSGLTIFWNSLKMLDLRNTWNLPNFLMFPGKSSWVEKKKVFKQCDFIQISSVRTLQRRGGTRNSFCSGVSSTAVGPTVDAFHATTAYYEVRSEHLAGT